MRFTFFCLIICSVCYLGAYAQKDSAALKHQVYVKDTAKIPSVKYAALPVSDSLAKEKRLQFVQDSIAMLYLVPDSNRESLLLTEVFKNNPPDFFSFTNKSFKPARVLKTGLLRTTRDPWIIETIIGLIIYTALLNLLFNQEIKNIFLPFYNKSFLLQADKDNPTLNSGVAIGLFLLFNLSFGLVLYQVTVYENVNFSVAGFQLFLIISAGTCTLFLLKFMVLKFIGVVFDINRLVSQYISIINLTYFNIAFLLLAVAVCFSLLDSYLIPNLLVTTLVITALIFAWQYLKNSVSMISSFRFRKFYLFVYLCALEICPVLILMKALNI
jgi:hypothetical protein